jgi:probable rRNA maturation factor
MIHIQTKKNVKLAIKKILLKEAILETFQFTNTSKDSDLTLVLTDDRKLHQLNLEYLGIDAPTDVLSFLADFNDPDSQERYLGDIIISVPRALAQAEENKSSVEAELILLTVHGTLHLLGYDHATVEDKEKMWAIQNEIVGKLT